MKYVRASGDTREQTAKSAKSERFAPMTDLSRAALAAHKARQEAAGINVRDTALVFTTKTGGQLSVSQVGTEFRTLLAAAGLDTAKFTPYSCRHTFGMICRHLGVTVDDISDAMGHAHEGSTTAIVYLNHAVQEALTVVVEKFNSEFPA